MDVKISLRSGLRRRVLEYYVTHPGAAPYVHELARKLALDPGNLSREMTKLGRLGLLVSQRRGRRKHYLLNPRNNLYPQLRRTLLRSANVVPLLEKVLGQVAGVQLAYLYGPCVRRWHNPHVPLDLLILGRFPAARLNQAIQRLERRLGRKIRCVVHTRAEFSARRRKNNTFLADFRWKPKIALVPVA
jgi:predicted transcriptional regulator with HTH domain